jgi:hypothetical protein
MAKLKFFDCNCSIGRVAYPLLYDIHDAHGLIKEMDVAGIEEALVYHTLARDGHAPVGNRMLLKQIKNMSRLHPVWILFPHHTGEFSKANNLLKEIQDNDVKAVRLYPTKDFHSFSLSEWCSGELFSALEEKRIPVFFDIEIISWDDVYNVIINHPYLPVIITNCSYRHNRYSYPLMEKYENIFIELSRYMGAGAVEDVVKNFGISRLLFGTNMPRYTGTAAVAVVTYSDLSANEKKALAGENLKNLLQRASS